MRPRRSSRVPAVSSEMDECPSRGGGRLIGERDQAGFLATTSERIARLRAVAFRTGVSARQIAVSAGPAE